MSEPELSKEDDSALSLDRLKNAIYALSRLLDPDSNINWEHEAFKYGVYGLIEMIAAEAQRVNEVVNAAFDELTKPKPTA
jgi:hypothetical protein